MCQSKLEISVDLSLVNTQCNSTISPRKGSLPWMTVNCVARWWMPPHGGQANRQAKGTHGTWATEGKQGVRTSPVEGYGLSRRVQGFLWGRVVEESIIRGWGKWRGMSEPQGDGEQAGDGKGGASCLAIACDEGEGRKKPPCKHSP